MSIFNIYSYNYINILCHSWQRARFERPSTLNLEGDTPSKSKTPTPSPCLNTRTHASHTYFITPKMNEETARATVRQIFDYIIAQGSADYIGEPVSQLEHTLQAAQLARDAQCDDETVLGALLHDVGRFLPAADKMPKMIAADGTYVGRASHEIVGERYLREQGFPEKVCQLVGAHVMAKRYLTAVDKGYHDGLSDASQKTLKMQVSVLNTSPMVEGPS